MCRAKVICLGVSVLECAFSIFFFSDAIAKSSVFIGIIGVAARCSKFPYRVFSRGIETGWTEKSRRGQYEATGKVVRVVRTLFALLKSMVRTR